MELRFIDPIGLVDPLIAHVRNRDHASPFHHQPPPPGRAEIRDHIFALRPKLVAFVAYIPDQFVRDLAAQAKTRTTPAERNQLFAPFIDMNAYYVGLHTDPRFARFQYVDVIRRKDNYWFVLFEDSERSIEGRIAAAGRYHHHDRLRRSVALVRRPARRGQRARAHGGGGEHLRAGGAERRRQDLDAAHAGDVAEPSAGASPSTGSMPRATQRACAGASATCPTISRSTIR